MHQIFNVHYKRFFFCWVLSENNLDRKKIQYPFQEPHFTDTGTLKAVWFQKRRSHDLVQWFATPEHWSPKKALSNVWEPVLTVRTPGVVWLASPMYRASPRTRIIWLSNIKSARAEELWCRITDFGMDSQEQACTRRSNRSRKGQKTRAGEKWQIYIFILQTAEEEITSSNHRHSVCKVKRKILNVLTLWLYLSICEGLYGQSRVVYWEGC